jgi:hypothetical protein
MRVPICISPKLQITSRKVKNHQTPCSTPLDTVLQAAASSLLDLTSPRSSDALIHRQSDIEKDRRLDIVNKAHTREETN